MYALFDKTDICELSSKVIKKGAKSSAFYSVAIGSFSMELRAFWNFITSANVYYSGYLICLIHNLFGCSHFFVP